ncbi:MAG: helix-turn-helix transcriptional regulator [Clostridia bacterium]|nr:helix-turn-helix transcriptional regulator [Clostridia bacterium]
MITNRYEEYVRFSDGVPFLLHDRLFRDAQTVRHEANWHENLELQLCEDGKGSVLLDGRRIAFEKGDLAAVNSGVIHLTEPNASLVYSCIIFESEFCRRAGIDIGSLCFESHFRSDRITALFARIREVYGDPSAVCRTARLQALALEMLIELRETHVKAVDVPPVDGAYRTVKNAISYIRSHFSEKISLDSVARGIYVNKYVLSRQFKAATKQTVVEYINAYRCTRAAQLLESGATVGEAAAACGYSNLSFFAKTFREYMGRLPKDWKR